MPTTPRPTLNAIRNLRLARSPQWTQDDLATAVGSCQQDISQYELGEVVPALTKAFDIANALGARVEDVFFELFEESQARIANRAPSTVTSP